jgi:hypothetical protein
LPPPPLPAVPDNDPEVLPRPLDPMAEELEALEPEAVELDDEEDGVAEVLPVVVVVPRRLVAAVNAEDAFDAELLDGELDEVELEGEEDEDEVGALVVLAEASRPWSLRLPLKFGVTSDV